MLLALDIAELTGAAWGGERDGFPRNALWQLPHGPANHYRALSALRATIATTIRSHAITIVCIEDWLTLKDREHSTAALVKLISLGAVAREVAQSHQCRIFTPPPATWRRAFIGTGSLSRDDAKRAAIARNRQLGWRFANEDVAEANGIWYWGVATQYPHWRPARAA